MLGRPGPVGPLDRREQAQRPSDGVGASPVAATASAGRRGGPAADAGDGTGQAPAGVEHGRRPAARPGPRLGGDEHDRAPRRSEPGHRAERPLGRPLGRVGVVGQRRLAR